MALAELGETMSQAIQQMLNATIIDEKVLNEFLDEISRALLQSDVPLDLVSNIQTHMKTIVNLEGDCDKPRLMQFAIFNKLCRILYHGNPSFTPEKGKASVIMFVGQGSEKTICTKYAYYHLKKGWKPALVCANTSRAGAFDQLEQNAINAKIPFYESYTESDPVRIAVEGVERFKKENCDLIIVDTSGCHKHDASLFEEMRQVAEATKPDLVIFVMDSSIGQAAAFDQAQAFKQSVSVGAVILTKMDGHAKGVGALSAVAATKSPVIFIDTGVLIDEFTVFDVTRFVSRILGMDDLFRWMDKIHKRKVFDRNVTLRTMYERFQKKLKRGSICKDFGQVIEATFQGYVTIMDFMTDEELDNSNPMLMTKTQMIRIAQASGQLVEDVMDLLAVYKQLEDTRRKMKELKILKKAEMSALSQNRRKMKELKILKKAEKSALSQNRKVLRQKRLKQIGANGGADK